MLSGPVRLTMVKPSGVGWMSLKSFQMAFFAKTGLRRKGLARLLRGAASAGLQRLGPQAAVGAGEAYRAVQRLVAHWDVELEAEAAHEVFLLVAVEDDGVDEADRGLPGVEVEPDGEGQPLAFAGSAAMHAFDLDDGADWAGLLHGDMLDVARRTFRVWASLLGYWRGRSAGCKRVGWCRRWACRR